MNTTMPSTHHRHCAWHKINHNLTANAKYKAEFAQAWKSDVEACNKLYLILRWMWLFIKHYETREECNVSMQLLSYYLSKDQDRHFGQLEEGFCMDISEFITKSSIANEHKLFEHTFMFLMILVIVTTLLNKAEQ